MPDYNGKPGSRPAQKATYTPEMREQYRDYYKNKNRTEKAAPPAQSSVKRPAQSTAAPRPAGGSSSGGTIRVGSSASLPRGSSNGTRLAGSDSAAPRAAAERPAQPRPAQPRPAQSRPAQPQRPAAARQAQARPVQSRTALRAQARRKKNANPFMDVISALFGGKGGVQYGRMLLMACLLVLLMFGIIKGIGAITRDEEPDYIVATKITDAPPQESGGETGETGAENDPEAEPTAIAVSDDGYFPEGEQSGETGEEQGDEPSVPAGTGRRATLRFAGDVVPDMEILTTAYNSKTEKYDFSSYFDLIRDQLSNADFTSLNVDGSMGGAQHDKYGRYTGYPQFNTPPTLLYALQGAGVDMLSLANNHCLDGWFDGLLDTIKNCDYIGMQHVGAFTSQEDFDTPEILDINGIRVGFLNYTQSLNSMDSRGVDPNALVWGLRRTRNADYEGDIQALRNAGAEVVIVIMHWGDEYLFTPDQDQVSMANRIAAAGADVIVGGHPHVFQAAGWKTATLADGTQHKCLIVYSLGNFLSEHRNEKKARTDAGIIFEFTLQENPATGKIEVVEPAYLPIAVWRVGSEGAFDYRVISVDAVLENRPGGMNDSAYARIQQISGEMEEVYGKSGFTRLAY